MLDGASAHIAGLLREQRRGAGRPRRASCCRTSRTSPSVYYGALRAGAVVVPMNVLLKGREVAFYCGDPESKVVFAWHDFAEAAEAGAGQAGTDCIVVRPGEFEELLVGSAPAVTEVADRADDDTAVILYTSGTTGTPKGAELTHANLRRNVEIAARAVRPRRRRRSSLGALPLFHSFGQTCGLNATISVGRLPDADPALRPRQGARDHRARPGHRLRGRADDVLGDAATAERATRTTPRRCSSASRAARRCPSRSCARFEEKFGCKILEGYGLTETSPVASFNHPDRERKPGLDRHADRGRRDEARRRGRQRRRAGRGRRDRHPRPQRDEGLLEQPGRDAASRSRDGWFHTGDMAQVDDDGYFFIVDRKKDMIIRGGYNVYPREIEEVLYEHPAVREAAVVGVPARRRWARRSARPSRSRTARTRRRGRAAGVRQGAGRGLQVPAPASGSSTSCRRGRPARSSSARSRYPAPTS